MHAFYVLTTCVFGKLLVQYIHMQLITIDLFNIFLSLLSLITVGT